MGHSKYLNQDFYKNFAKSIIALKSALPSLAKPIISRKNILASFRKLQASSMGFSPVNTMNLVEVGLMRSSENWSS